MATLLKYLGTPAIDDQHKLVTVWKITVISVFQLVTGLSSLANPCRLTNGNSAMPFVGRRIETKLAG